VAWRTCCTTDKSSTSNDVDDRTVSQAFLFSNEDEEAVSAGPFTTRNAAFKARKAAKAARQKLDIGDKESLGNQLDKQLGEAVCSPSGFKQASTIGTEASPSRGSQNSQTHQASPIVVVALFDTDGAESGDSDFDEKGFRKWRGNFAYEECSANLVSIPPSVPPYPKLQELQPVSEQVDSLKGVPKQKLAANDEKYEVKAEDRENTEETEGIGLNGTAATEAEAARQMQQQKAVAEAMSAKQRQQQRKAAAMVEAAKQKQQRQQHQQEQLEQLQPQQLRGRQKLVSQDGAIYEGEMSGDGTRHGEGSCNFADGSRYTGQWKEDKMAGTGVMYWPNGARYQGQFQRSSQHGEGSFWWPNGRQYSGQWICGRQHGRGSILATDGTVLCNGRWRRGQLLEQPPSDTAAASHSNTSFEGHQAPQHGGTVQRIQALSRQEVSSRRRKFTVELVRKSGCSKKLGVDVALERDSLMIESIQEGGLFAEWNMAHPDRAVNPGDMLIAVNGCEGDVDQMASLCAKAPRVEVTVLRDVMSA